jgi:crossover junction endodeoxyribonuclease RuvC
MRILGIDPGMAIVGYCLLDYCADSEDQPYTIVNCGSIQTPKGVANSKRLLEIHNDLISLINEYKPDAAAVEQLFFFKNAKTVMSVSEARGVILMTLEMMGVPIFEYTPLVVKQSVTGYGRSDKKDVRDMVKMLFAGQHFPKLDDTSDAVAIAVCHCSFFRQSEMHAAQ